MGIVLGTIGGEVVDKPTRDGEGLGGAASGSGLGLC